jgi:hypothetical protein
MQIDLVVLLAEEAGEAVMCALDDVQRHVVEIDAKAACHDGSLGYCLHDIEPVPFGTEGLDGHAICTWR